MKLDEKIGQLLERRAAERFDRQARIAVERLSKLADAPQQIEALAHEPEMGNAHLGPEEASWPLSVLAVPSAASVRDIAQQQQFMTQCLEHAAASMPADATISRELPQVREKLCTAAAFLSWPQNRDRVEYALELFPELRPKPEPLPSTAPTLADSALEATGYLFKLCRESFFEPRGRKV